MSIPSSSEDVATIARSVPDFSASSTSRRCSRASAPWCARTRSSPASSFSREASRSASRRAFTNTIVERCARISSSRRGWIDGQIDAWAGDCPAPDGPSRSGGAGDGSACALSSAMSSTGTTTSSSIGLRWPASTMATGRAVPSSACPPRNRAISSSGRCVADSPMRCGGVCGDRVQALQRQGEVRAALGGGEGVDLVDDHPTHAAQRLARLRREHQVEGLRAW